MPSWADRVCVPYCRVCLAGNQVKYVLANGGSDIWPQPMKDIVVEGKGQIRLRDNGLNVFVLDGQQIEGSPISLA
jgi:hypothetical protein